MDRQTPLKQLRTGCWQQVGRYMQYLTLQPSSGFEATLQCLGAFCECMYLSYMLEVLVVESPHKDSGPITPLSVGVLWSSAPGLVSSNRNLICAHQHHSEKTTNM